MKGTWSSISRIRISWARKVAPWGCCCVGDAEFQMLPTAPCLQSRASSGSRSPPPAFPQIKCGFISDWGQTGGYAQCFALSQGSQWVDRACSIAWFEEQQFHTLLLTYQLMISGTWFLAVIQRSNPFPCPVLWFAAAACSSTTFLQVISLNQASWMLGGT